MQEKLVRNEEIYTRKVNGETYRKLSTVYDLSIPTLQQIVSRVKRRKQAV